MSRLTDRGWRIVRVTDVNGSSVTFEDGLGISSPHIYPAFVGDVWAILIVDDVFAYGRLDKAVLLEGRSTKQEEQSYDESTG